MKRLVLAAGLGWMALAAACAPPSRESGVSPARAAQGDPDAIERGRRLFMGACTGYCHPAGPGSKGEAPDLFDCVWLHGGRDDEIYHTVSRGVPETPMVGFEGRLSEADIWRVVAYLRHASTCPDAAP